ncbi:MAG: TolC family protein [Planctomycetes bacterium]|nr:TolC family protein [Planctomycetota bacterium]
MRFFQLCAAWCAAWLVASCTSDARLARHEFERVPAPVVTALNEARTSGTAGATAVRALQSVTLAELLRQSELRSPGLAAAYHRWRAAVAEIGTAVEIPEAMLEYFEGIEDPRSNIMLDGGKRGVMFTQPVTNPGKLVARERMLAAEATVMAQDYDAFRRSVRLRAALGYFDIQALDARVAVTGELVQLMRDVEESMEPMLASGMATQGEYLRMQVERAEMESDLQSLKLRRGALVRQLVAASGVEMAPDVKLDVLAYATAATVIPERARLFVAVEENPMLRMEHARAAVAHARQVEAHWMWVPDFVVGASWMDMGTPMGEGGTWSAVSVRAGISIPWQFHVSKARSDAAAANELAARLVVEQRKLDLMAELDMALFELSDAERMQKLLADDVLPKARMALDLVRTDFSTGKARLSDVLGAQRSVLAGEISRIRTRAEVLKARAMLLSLTGLQLKSEGE